MSSETHCNKMCRNTGGGIEKAHIDYIRADSNDMLGQFDSNWLPTLALALTGFTGLAFCQQPEVTGREGRDEYHIRLHSSISYTVAD